MLKRHLHANIFKSHFKQQQVFNQIFKNDLSSAIMQHKSLITSLSGFSSIHFK